MNTYARLNETSEHFLERFRGVFIIQNIENPGKSWAMNNGELINLGELDPAEIADGAASIIQSRPTLRLGDFTYGFYFPIAIEGDEY
jgi:hypothetical protein